MTKAIVVALLAALGLVACSSAGSRAPASASEADADYLYGRHAGQPMRDAPDGNM